MSRARHLYVHLPFCASRCGYCAFVVQVDALDRRDAYLDAVLGELALEDGRLAERVETVYLGGGTPTLMGADRIARLLDHLRDRMAPGAEVTVEANPETVEEGVLAHLLAAGVTRISMGAQSFQPHLLARLDRAATPERVRAALVASRRAGVPSLSVDLLFAVPGQTPEDLSRDIDEILAHGPDHISWYELEVKPHTGLAIRGERVDEDFSEDAYHRVVDALEAGGYRWYETANFARPGHEARHNLAYWGAADYLGVGIGAVSTLGGRRWRNAPDLDGYIASVAAGRAPRRTAEALDPRTRRLERWMLGLRRDGAIDRSALGEPDHPDALAELADIGLLTFDDTEIRLTRAGRFVQNAVAGRLMDFA